MDSGLLRVDAGVKRKIFAGKNKNSVGEKYRLLMVLTEVMGVLIAKNCSTIWKIVGFSKRLAKRPTGSSARGAPDF